MDTSLVTKILLKGETDPSLSKAFQTAEKNLNRSLKRLKKYGDAAKKAAKIAATATIAGLGASIKSAIEYESAFAGVKKTVEETDTTSYEDISNAIRNMAKTMPATTTEIAAVAEAAGQLGIKADDIEKFTKVMVNLGTTTNLSSEEAATSIAKMFNITGTSMQNVDRFGATIVALGNNAATTESDIVAMATRIASSGTQIGLTEQQILAMATSLSSVGLEAEAGGTAISTVMTQIDKSVALNSEELATWAQTAGMSTAQFKRAWENDAYGAMQKVIQGMGDTNKNGGNLNILLEELGITGIRTSDTMKRLSSASGLMSDMTDLANKAWNENSALTIEANTRYATLASKIQIAKNKINDMAITIGNKLTPYVDKLLAKMDEIDFDEVAQKVIDKIDWVIEHFDQLKVAVGIAATVFATFKVAKFINELNNAAKAFKTFMNVVNMTERFGKFKALMLKLPGVQGAVTAAQWLMNTSFYGCPVVWIIAIIIGLIGVFVLLWKKCDWFRNFWIGLWEGIKTVVSNVGNWLKNFFTVTIPNAWNTCVTWFQNGVQKVKTFFVNLGTSIKNGFNTAINFIKSLPSRIWNWLLQTISRINEWRLQMIQKAKDLGSKFLSAIGNFFSQLPYKIGYALGYAIGKVISWGISLVNWAKVNIPKFINSVITFFKQLPGKIWTWLVNVVNKLNTWRINMLNKAKELGTRFLTAVVNFFKQLPGKVWTWLVNTFNKVNTWRVNMLNKAKELGTKFLTAVVNFFKQLPGKVWTWLVNTAQKVVSWGAQLAAKGKAAAIKLLNSIINTVKQIPGKMLSLGKDIVQGLWNGIKNAKDWLVGKIKSFASGITDGIKDALGINSPSVVMEKLFKWVPMGAGEGILRNAKYAVNAVKTMGGKVAKASAKITPTIQTKVASVGSKIKAFASGGTVTKPQTAIVGDAPETIVPHGNTRRNRALLGEAAAGVGASIGGNTFNVTFAPVINGGNAEENRRMLREEEELFERKMDEYFEKKVRLAF